MRSRSTVGHAAVAFVAAFTFAACGGDDTTGNATGTGETTTGGLDDEAFCARFEALEAEAEAMTDDERDEAFFDVVTELADAAPDPDVADALGRLAEMAERLEGLDEDDPDAFGEAFAMMFDPELLGAMERLETYLVEVCGFEDLGTDDEFEFSSEWSDDPAIEFDEDAYEVLSDDLSSLRERLEPFVEGEFGYGLMRFMGSPSVSVDVDVSLNDPVEVCSAVGRLIDELLSAEGLEVIVNDRDDWAVVAERPPGGVCEAS